MTKLDVLVVAAHPDDAEISIGGTILRLVESGRQVGIVDMTRGELGTRGTAEDRARETAAANRLLGLALRENLELPDGRVEESVEARERLAATIRRHRPEILIAHHVEDLHPDHQATGLLARSAWYLSGLRRLALPGDAPASRPKRLYHFMSHVAFEPTFVVDIGPVWERKVALVRCYESQLRPEDGADRGQHLLFGADILARMETKARTYGERIGVRYGEPLFHRGPLPCFDPLLTFPSPA
jgi:bacillithiol biosynthesis deacetylase BshB1